MDDLLKSFKKRYPSNGILLVDHAYVLWDEDFNLIQESFRNEIDIPEWYILFIEHMDGTFGVLDICYDEAHWFDPRGCRVQTIEEQDKMREFLSRLPSAGLPTTPLKLQPIKTAWNTHLKGNGLAECFSFLLQRSGDLRYLPLLLDPNAVLEPIKYETKLEFLERFAACLDLPDVHCIRSGYIIDSRYLSEEPINLRYRNFLFRDTTDAPCITFSPSEFNRHVKRYTVVLYIINFTVTDGARAPFYLPQQHANVLILDHETHRVTWYEPHGRRNKTAKHQDKLQFMLDNLTRVPLRPWDLERDTGPWNGIQTRTRLPACFAYTLRFLHKRFGKSAEWMASNTQILQVQDYLNCLAPRPVFL